MAKKTILEYPVTSESLAAILAGLEIDEEDRVLTVGASGDQAFALLERAGKVIVAETQRSQLDYIRMRRELLKKGDYRGFLNAAKRYGRKEKVEANLPKILKYFDQEGRLERIRGNLKNLKMPRQPLDIFTAMKQAEYNKLYLSNLLTWGKRPDEALFYLRQMAESIPSDCLVYVSQHGPMVYVIAPLIRKEIEIKEGEQSLLKQSSPLETASGILPEGLTLDIRLTNITRQLETGNWSPAVYRKV